ncbi:S1 RNA-binding domain-containing protein [Embleya sp. MST-111070]|uniref:S1 RNA-binding domain-containing protein n=1 Tax=Embleya sp. MST-111070 TaxID=3398231 RepID=UPI003F73826A
MAEATEERPGGTSHRQGGAAGPASGDAERDAVRAWLAGRRRGEVLTGTVASIERFGVFVALDGSPKHPVFPGVGFITFPELSWKHFDDAERIVHVGERIAAEFLAFDTHYDEARLSLKAVAPDPWRIFADTHAVGARLAGTVTKLVPFGAFVRVGDGIEGLVPLDELAPTPVRQPSDVVQVGDDVTVTVTVIDIQLEHRRIALSLVH